MTEQTADGDDYDVVIAIMTPMLALRHRHRSDDLHGDDEHKDDHGSW